MLQYITLFIFFPEKHANKNHKYGSTQQFIGDFESAAEWPGKERPTNLFSRFLLLNKISSLMKISRV